jgi:methylisocitrate lyase
MASRCPPRRSDIVREKPPAERQPQTLEDAMARKSKSLRKLLHESTQCVMAPCVYDCASARAVEMVGFPAMMLSGGEVSIAMNGVIDYGFTNLTDLEWITSRISQTSGIPLAADIEDGFGGPIAVYRSARRMVMAGAKAIQLEDAGDMEESTELLPRARSTTRRCARPLPLSMAPTAS